ncbi:hypothetical protein Agabi119p4_10917 [Agaricus bisporus var. burnettii]|uniref:tRNA-splicing endonuclease subunit Sen15 domain-containing protein n=1 Tax=Agaricus bisporus var. burnettii TaxID=192524 RepID=A0A8H7EVP2_AGABI|nr:hypothetical protein Agabi119p4_10917 [Agaricus bisporus var. burnettii]
MNQHPSYTVLEPLMAKYPRASGSLFQAYNDIVYAQEWCDVEVVDLEKCARGAIKGRKKSSNVDMHVVPCTLSEKLSTQLLNDAFVSLGEPSEIYLATTSEDASIVYYKISTGIVKPPM